LEVTLVQKKKSAEGKQKRKSNKEWIGWTLLGVFIVGSIAGMFTVDLLYAPEFVNPNTLPEAVGK